MRNGIIRLLLMFVASSAPTVVTGDVAYSGGAAVAFGLVALNMTYEKRQTEEAV